MNGEQRLGYFTIKSITLQVDAPEVSAGGEIGDGSGKGVVPEREGPEAREVEEDGVGDLSRERRAG